MPRTCANRFGQIGYRHVEDEQPIPIEETLAALTALVRAGKARYILERMVSIPNPYNLLNRSLEVGLAEFAIRERIGVLLGASTLAQLEQDLAAEALRLSPQIMDELEQIQRRHPNPAG
jgi:aryl-alcohol dehydrogenase-like predicted oxidoreductase